MFRMEQVIDARLKHLEEHFPRQAAALIWSM
jgi:hypothetical protein